MPRDLEAHALLERHGPFTEQSGNYCLFFAHTVDGSDSHVDSLPISAQLVCMNPTTEGAPTQSGSRVDRVRAAIEARISSGRLASGDRLNEQAIAEEFDISRGPVREAIRSLSVAGRVRPEHHRGVFVCRIELREVGEIYDLRAAVFGLACGYVARRMTPRRRASSAKAMSLAASAAGWRP